MHTTPCNTVTITPCSSLQTPTRPVHCHLSFSADTDHTPGNTPACSDSSAEEEEDFQMVLLDDEHWTLEDVLKELFVYMNMDYHTTYANTHAPMGAITLFHTWIVWT